MTQSLGNMVACEALREGLEVGQYYMFDAAEMRDPDATENDVFLALAKHVPALSSPVGGNAIWSDNTKAVDMNLDNDRGGVPRR